MKTTDKIILALDVHGGDFGAAVTIPAALDVLATQTNVEFILCGIKKDIESLLPEQDSDRITIVEASHALASDARPVEALRRGRGSSLWLAMELVASERAHACVSAGSTAAMLALGVKLLGMLRGIERPALMSRIPSASGHTSLLDLGATLNVSANQLVQFAIMGSVASPLKNGSLPTVALLNVGHEESKGDSVIREAHAMLNELPINYTGFIEGHDIFAGKADVAVCDGFSGNLILKSGEGLATMFFRHLEMAFRSSLPARIGGALAKPALERILERFEPAKHNGAPLLGLRSVVVKSHGNADREAMVNAILEALEESRRQVPEQIEAMIQDYSIEVDV